MPWSWAAVAMPSACLPKATVGASEGRGEADGLRSREVSGSVQFWADGSCRALHTQED